MHLPKKVYLLANFGGPRSLDEIEEFLIELLSDQEVIRTPFPGFLHRFFFKRVAKKRVPQVTPDYALIGGKSPIYEDTEWLAEVLQEKLQAPVIPFHRYLRKTHAPFIETMNALEGCDEIRVFPLFPQYSTATTGSMALFFKRHLKRSIVAKMRWVASYPDDPGYLAAFEKCIREEMVKERMKEEETVLIFSAHGLPKRYVETGDVYQQECELTYELLKRAFPRARSHLCYQSQFGKEEWLRPYTKESVQEIAVWGKGCGNALFIPLSFTSDHVETLFEIQEQYLPVVEKQGFHVRRCPALNRRPDWIEAMAAMMREKEGKANGDLIRGKWL
jgi:ferrochelatase